MATEQYQIYRTTHALPVTIVQMLLLMHMNIRVLQVRTMTRQAWFARVSVRHVHHDTTVKTTDFQILRASAWQGEL